MNDYLLAAVEPTWAPGTLRHWYNTLVGAKYDSTKSPNQKKRGRKPISKEIVDKVLLLSQRNPDGGYDRIAGTMKYLGYDVCASTVKHILDDFGIVPDPERRKRGDWNQFIETQQHVTTATDFAQVEILTPYGLVRESLLFFMDIGTREVRCGGSFLAPGCAIASLPHPGTLPVSGSAVTVDAIPIVSCLKRAEQGDGIIFRGWNPTLSAVEATPWGALTAGQKIVVLRADETLHTKTGEKIFAAPSALLTLGIGIN